MIRLILICVNVLDILNCVLSVQYVHVIYMYFCCLVFIPCVSVK
jgi:hypothetical protein